MSEVQALALQQEAKTAARHQQARAEHTNVRGKAKAVSSGKPVKGPNDGALKKKRDAGCRELPSKKRLKVPKEEASESGASASAAAKARKACKASKPVQGGEDDGEDKDMVDADTGAKDPEDKSGSRDSASDLAASIEECTVFVKNLNFEVRLTFIL